MGRGYLEKIKYKAKKAKNDVDVLFLKNAFIENRLVENPKMEGVGVIIKGFWVAKNTKKYTFLGYN